MDSASQATHYGTELRTWRIRRGLSQLDLALRCGTSQRHLSFLETGRARPSRGMVLALAGVLDVPLRHQNTLLLSAGFAPAFRETDMSAPELGPVGRAIDLTLEKLEPYPTLVVDRRWKLLRANEGAKRLQRRLFGGETPLGTNIMLASLAPEGRDLVENWEEVAIWTLRRAQGEALVEGTAEAAKFVDELLDLPDLPKLAQTPKAEAGPLPPVLTVRFRAKEGIVALFTTLATLGTPLDVTLQEVRIETFFPADDFTQRWLSAKG